MYSRSFEVERISRGRCGWNDDGMCSFGDEYGGGERTSTIMVAEVISCVLAVQQSTRHW